MKNSIYMALWLLLTPLASLPMGFLTNNSLTKNLAFLSRMRFTKPTITVNRPYFSKSINVMKTNRDKFAKEISNIKSGLIDFNKNTTVRVPERIEKTQKTITMIQENERTLTNLQNEIDKLTNLNSEYNSIYKEYVKSLENSKFEETNQHVIALEKKYAEVNKFKEHLKSNWRFTFINKDKNGNSFNDVYKFDEE